MLFTIRTSIAQQRAVSSSPLRFVHLVLLNGRRDFLILHRVEEVPRVHLPDLGKRAVTVTNQGVLYHRLVAKVCALDKAGFGQWYRDS